MTLESLSAFEFVTPTDCWSYSPLLRAWKIYFCLASPSLWLNYLGHSNPFELGIVLRIFFTRNESSLVRVTDRWSNLRTSTWLCSSARGVIAIAKTRLVLESNYVVRGVVSPLAYITFCEIISWAFNSLISLHARLWSKWPCFVGAPKNSCGHCILPRHTTIISYSVR